jgi:hypothetical protein
MSLKILFYDGKYKDEGVSIPVRGNDFASLLANGMGKIPHCNTDDLDRCIDLKIFCVKVEMILDKLDPPHKQRKEMVSLIKHYRYLKLVN